MITAFLFVWVLLHCLPRNVSTCICPESFSCLASVTLKYPFYNVSDTRCGLIKVNCTSKGGEIRLAGRSYAIVPNQDHHDRVFFHNGSFDDLVKKNSCEALMNNFISPSPLLYSISITPNITLFKCPKNDNQRDHYFKQHEYESYNICKQYNFYYNYLNGAVPSDLPHTCEVVQLPVRLPGPELVENNIFSLLSSNFSISAILSPSCDDCYRRGRVCDVKNGVVACSCIIKDSESTTVSSLDKKPRLVKILAIAGSALCLMLSCVIYVIWRHCKNSPFSYVSSKNRSQDLQEISLSSGVFVFSYKELEDATQNFNPSHQLGDGGFGAVYYGKLQDGREIAVKKLYEHNYRRVQQFINEVEILTKLRHPNLVVLYGCTSSQSCALLLVYEFVPNRTVADHLHGEQANPSMLTWKIRMNIAIETARALVYLHASEIIHRDVKTSNILLDYSFCVKVADFGLSRLIPYNVTHVSTAPQGTPGYVDPQYHQCYQLTDKSDVYSFGVVLIELISSMVAIDLNRPQDEISLANFALNRIQKGAIDQLIDPTLGSDTNPEIMNMITSVAELAFQCLQYDSEMRPTMNEVLDVFMDIQARGGVASYDSNRDFEMVNALPTSETNDEVVLLKEFRPSPVSVTNEWQSSNSSSATISSNGDRLSMKNGINP